MAQSSLYMSFLSGHRRRARTGREVRLLALVFLSRCGAVFTSTSAATDASAGHDALTMMSDPREGVVICRRLSALSLLLQLSLRFERMQRAHRDSRHARTTRQRHGPGIRQNGRTALSADGTARGNVKCWVRRVCSVVRSRTPPDVRRFDFFGYAAARALHAYMYM